MHRTRLPLASLGALAALLLALAAAFPTPAHPAPVPPLAVADEAETKPVPAAPARAPDQLLTRMGVDRWAAAGVRGKGVKVAIIDTGFRHWRDQLGKSLPAHVAARSFRA